MEAAVDKGISQMVSEQEDLLRQQHDQLAQLVTAIGEVYHRCPRGWDTVEPVSQPIQQSVQVSSVQGGLRSSTRDGGECLLHLRQEGQTSADYTLIFRTVAASCRWTELALRTLFQRGLREEFQTVLAC